MAYRPTAAVMLSLAASLLLTTTRADTDDVPAPRVRKDRHGDPLPPGAITRLGSIRFRHLLPSHCVAFAGDGKTLAWADPEGRIHIWETATARELRRFPGQPGYSIALSPDGKMVAWGQSDTLIRLSSAATGEELRRCKADPLGPGSHSLSTLAFSQDGKMLAAAVNYAPYAIRIWDTATGKEIRHLPTTDFITWTLAFSPNGKHLAAADSQRLRVWDVASGKQRLEQTGALSWRSLGFSRDSRFLAWTRYEQNKAQSVALLDMSTGKELPAIAVGCSSIAFSADGKTLLARQENRLGLWDLASRKQVRVFEGELTGDRNTEWVVAFSADGKTLSAAGNREIRQWDAATGKALVHHQFNRGVQIHGLIAVSSDGAFLAAGHESIRKERDERVGLWHLHQDKLFRVLRCKKNPAGLASLCFSPDGKLVAVGAEDNGWVMVWETATGKELYVFQFGYNNHVAFSPDSQTLAAAPNGGQEVQFWEMKTGKTVGAFHGRQHDSIQALSYSPDGKLLALGMTKRVAFLDVATRKEVRAWAEGLEDNSWIAFSPNGKHLCSRKSNGAISVRDAATGRELRRFPSIGLASAFSPDGKTVATISDNHSICLWEAATGQERHRFQGHEAGITSIAFARDGQLLISGSHDTTALVWDSTGFTTDERRHHWPRPTPKELEALWDELAGPDARKAFRAMAALGTATQDAIPFLEKRLQPTAAPDRARLTQLVADLDSDEFAVREKATSELQRIGLIAEPSLQKAFAGPLSLEARRRLDFVLKQVQRGILPPRDLQVWRAVEVLERIGTLDARALLERLGQGVADSYLTVDVRAAAARVSRRLGTHD
jgi:WD40 repeat protein